MMIAAFPDLTFTTQFMVGEGKTAGAFSTVSGTHRGDFMGIPATENSFTVDNADYCRFTQEETSGHRCAIRHTQHDLGTLRSRRGRTWPE